MNKQDFFKNEMELTYIELQQILAKLQYINLCLDKNNEEYYNTIIEHMSECLQEMKEEILGA